MEILRALLPAGRMVVVAELADEKLILLKVRHQPSKRAVDAAQELSVYRWV